MIQAISNESSQIPIDFLCTYFGVSRSGYYKWQSCKKTIKFVRKEKLCAAIKESFLASDKTYGSPRIYDDLIDKGFRVSENTVAKYMQELGLDARLKKKFMVKTTDSNHNSPIADRLFKVEDHNSLPSAPGEVLAGDISVLQQAA
ncbi:MAG: IS3 family transposase [Oligoflexales bacterium]